MSKLRTITAVVCAGLMGAALTARGGTRELSYAAEDAAFQAAMQMANDSRVNVKRIAFVKLLKGDKSKERHEMETVFRTGLSQVPTDFEFLVNQARVDDWTEIDGFFDAVTDFGDYDKKTIPRTGVFKMADAYMIAEVTDVSEEANETKVLISFELIRIETAEIISSGNIEGVYDSGAEHEMVDNETRKAIEGAVAKAMESKTLSRLNNYQVLVIPLEGQMGRAVADEFKSKLVANASIKVLGLPGNSKSDRSIARFLRERIGTKSQVSNSFLKKISSCSRLEDNVVVMKGTVTTYEKSDVSVTIDFNTNFVDVNDSFAILASADGTKIVKIILWDEWKDKLLRFFREGKNVKTVLLVLAGLIVVGVFLKVRTRVR